MPEARTPSDSHAYLSLGGNIGDVSATFVQALRRLEAGGARVVKRSADYETPPWGKTDQPPFVNACAEVATTLAPIELLRLCLEVEASLGRVRKEKWGPRIIDIDVLAYDGVTLDSEDLKLPHPYMLERAFVVVPLSEIAADLVIAGRRIGDVARELEPGSGIVRRGG
jgi:2-amino-4-hydroxy-6-hydroxymethyldihydropteridine diphosphokinase